MEIIITKKNFWKLSFLLGFIMFIFGCVFNFTYLYYKDTVTLYCEYGGTEIYNKTDLNKLDKVCDGVNIYKYNDNTGLGVYFPNREAVEKANNECCLNHQQDFYTPINISIYG